MSDTAKVGTVVSGYEFEDVPEGTLLVRVGTTDIVERDGGSGFYFKDRSSAQGQFVVISVPEAAAKPDLSDKASLALALYRARTNSTTDTIPGYSQEDWDRLAAWVQDNFEVKTARSAQYGAKVRVVNAEHGWANRTDIGKTGTVEETVDSDDTLYVRFENGSPSYIHVKELELA